MGSEDEPKVLLTLQDGVIAAKRYSFVSSREQSGIAARCDDGSEKFFVETTTPTNREFYGIEASNASSYAEMKKAIQASTGWLFDEEFRWLETDANGDVMSGTDTVERMTHWLNAEVDGELLEYWGERTASEYAPGFALAASLTDGERQDLGIHEGDLGGPASSVPCVVTGATIEQLNRIISRKGLPYVFVDGEGWPEEE